MAAGEEAASGEDGAGGLQLMLVAAFCLPRGVGPGCNTREIAHKLIELKADIEDLEQREQELEQQKMWVQQSIRNVTEDVQNSRYPWRELVTLSPCWLVGPASPQGLGWGCPAQGRGCRGILAAGDLGQSLASGGTSFLCGARPLVWCFDSSDV